jgi:hypothetical protein
MRPLPGLHTRYGGEDLIRDLDGAVAITDATRFVVNHMPFTDAPFRFGAAAAATRNVTLGYTRDLALSVHGDLGRPGVPFDLDGNSALHTPTALAATATELTRWLTARIIPRHHRSRARERCSRTAGRGCSVANRGMVPVVCGPGTRAGGVVRGYRSGNGSAGSGFAPGGGGGPARRRCGLVVLVRRGAPLAGWAARRVRMVADDDRAAVVLRAWPIHASTSPRFTCRPDFGTHACNRSTTTVRLAKRASCCAANMSEYTLGVPPQIPEQNRSSGPSGMNEYPQPAHFLAVMACSLFADARRTSFSLALPLWCPSCHTNPVLMVPGPVAGNRSLVGMLIRDFRTAPESARNWTAGLISGVLAAVIGGLIVFYVTSH